MTGSVERLFDANAEMRAQSGFGKQETGEPAPDADGAGGEARSGETESSHAVRDAIDDLNKRLSLTKQGFEKKSEQRNMLAKLLKENRTKERYNAEERSRVMEVILDEYTETKVTGMQAVRETVNTALVATGALTMRGISYGLLDAGERYQRLARESRKGKLEAELGAMDTAEGADSSAEFMGAINRYHDKKQLKDSEVGADVNLGRDVLIGSITETAREAFFIGAKEKGFGRAAIDAVKAYGKIGRYLGMSFTMSHSPDAFGKDIDKMLDTFSGKESFSDAVKSNFLGNLTRTIDGYRNMPHALKNGFDKLTSGAKDAIGEFDPFHDAQLDVRNAAGNAAIHAWAMNGEVGAAAGVEGGMMLAGGENAMDMSQDYANGAVIDTVQPESTVQPEAVHATPPHPHHEAPHIKPLTHEVPSAAAPASEMRPPHSADAYVDPHDGDVSSAALKDPNVPAADKLAAVRFNIAHNNGQDYYMDGQKFSVNHEGTLMMNGKPVDAERLKAFIPEEVRLTSPELSGAAASHIDKYGDVSSSVFEDSRLSPEEKMSAIRFNIAHNGGQDYSMYGQRFSVNHEGVLIGPDGKPLTAESFEKFVMAPRRADKAIDSSVPDLMAKKPLAAGGEFSDTVAGGTGAGSIDQLTQPGDGTSVVGDGHQPLPSGAPVAQDPGSGHAVDMTSHEPAHPAGNEVPDGKTPVNHVPPAEQPHPTPTHVDDGPDHVHPRPADQQPHPVEPAPKPSIKDRADDFEATMAKGGQASADLMDPKVGYAVKLTELKGAIKDGESLSVDGGTVTRHGNDFVLKVDGKEVPLSQKNLADTITRHRAAIGRVSEDLKVGKPAVPPEHVPIRPANGAGNETQPAGHEETRPAGETLEARRDALEADVRRQEGIKAVFTDRNRSPAERLAALAKLKNGDVIETDAFKVGVDQNGQKYIVDAAGNKMSLNPENMRRASEVYQDAARKAYAASQASGTEGRPVSAAPDTGVKPVGGPKEMVAPIAGDAAVTMQKAAIGQLGNAESFKQGYDALNLSMKPGDSIDVGNGNTVIKPLNGGRLYLMGASRTTFLTPQTFFDRVTKK